MQGNSKNSKGNKATTYIKHKFNAVRRSSAETIVSDISGTLTRAISSTLVLLATISAVVIVHTHHKDFAKGIFGATLSKSTSPIAVWIVANSKKSLGMITFLPSILSAPTKDRVLISLVVFFLVFSLPVQEMWHYVSQSLLVLIYFRCRMMATRVSVIFAIIACVVFEIYTIH